MWFHSSTRFFYCFYVKCCCGSFFKSFFLSQVRGKLSQMPFFLSQVCGKLSQPSFFLSQCPEKLSQPSFFLSQVWGKLPQQGFSLSQLNGKLSPMPGKLSPLGANGRYRPGSYPDFLQSQSKWCGFLPSVPMTTNTWDADWHEQWKRFLPSVEI